jgi:Fic family protein
LTGCARAPGGLSNFEHMQDLELTYTSNAIQGNTLTAVETTLVVKKGITIGGKPLKDHLEAVDHFEALHYVRELARQTDPRTELDARNLHRLVVLRPAPEIAGRYADQGRLLLTDAGRHGFPSPEEVPARMGDFARRVGGGQRRRRRLSLHIASWWIFIRSTTATDVPHGS